MFTVLQLLLYDVRVLNNLKGTKIILILFLFIYINAPISAIYSYGWSNFHKCFSFKTQGLLLVFPSFCLI